MSANMRSRSRRMPPCESNVGSLMPPEGKHLLRDEDGPIFDTGVGCLFQRLHDGSVKIAQGGTTTRIGPGTWEAVVSSMSARGESMETLQEALRLHERQV